MRRLAPFCCALLVLLLVAPAADAGIRYGSRAMKPGMRGQDVSVLQKFLTRLGHPTTRTAYFNKATKRSVMKLEKKRGWKRDGKVSRKQAKKIKALVARQPKLAGTGNRYFFYSGTAPTVTVTGDRAGTVRVDAVDVNGSVVMSLTASLSPGGGGGGTSTSYSANVAWYGRASDGKPAPDGTYGLAIGDGGGTGARITGGQVGTFSLYAHKFPVRGPHDYGGAGSRFGAGRGDHIHQGQDLSAACGTPLVAAQGGNVRVRSYQGSGAGYYIVIRGKGSGKDYVYMHMQGPGPLSAGDKVRTGQRIGKVGSTGSSTGCHLHFERWTKPGWYEGGKPYDPLKSLKYWDSYS